MGVADHNGLIVLGGYLESRTDNGSLRAYPPDTF